MSDDKLTGWQNLRRRMPRWLLALWAGMRQWSGDDAYERYLAHHNQAHSETAPMDRQAFHRHQQTHRFSGVTRCC